MSDHYTTQLNHRDRVLQQLRDVLYWAEHSHYSHHQYLGALRERVYDRNSWQRLTGYNKQYCEGYLRAAQEKMEFQHHDWRVYHPEFGHVRKKDYACLDGRWSEVVGDLGASFWKDTDDKLWSGSPGAFRIVGGDPSHGLPREKESESNA